MSTLICPCHNEQEMLPQTINSMYNVGADEIIFLLDRCTDATETVIDAKIIHENTETLVIHVNKNEGKGWRFRSAFLRRKGYTLADNDTIINTSADIVLDPKIREYIKLIPKYGLVSFGYLEKPWNIQQFMRILISETKISHGFAGLLALSKKAWEETEDIEELKQIERAEDTHLQYAIKSKYPTKHINTKSIHLRPNENFRDHYKRGLAQYQVQHISPLQSFLHSLVMIRPAVFTGYIHAKHLRRNQ